jgi:hypothetical protein
MKNELIKLGYVPTKFIEIEYPSKKIKGYSEPTYSPVDLMVKVINEKDFIVISPNLFGGKAHVQWSGNVEEELKKLKDLEKWWFNEGR